LTLVDSPARFGELAIHPDIARAIADLGFIAPTPVQERAIPVLQQGRDLFAQAQTGTGKTAAFAIPIVERVDSSEKRPQALVIVPTRELALQVTREFGAIGKHRHTHEVAIYGGVPYGPQERALARGAQIVIGTPGRVLDHLQQGTLRLDALVYFVLDEADEMLDRGFGPDVDRIIQRIPAAAAARQTALFSATVPEWVRDVAARLLENPAEVRVDTGRPAAAAPESVEHLVYEVPAGAKPAVLRTLLNEGAGTTTGHPAGHAAGRREGYPAAALQSDLAQGARDRVIGAFRTGEVPILIATNVAARGLDIPDLARVINYDLPENGALFTHRVGRTGRMGRAGEAITLLAPEDQTKWRQLERELKAAGLARPFPRRPWTGPLPAAPEPARPVAAPAAPSAARGVRWPAAAHPAPPQTPTPPNTQASAGARWERGRRRPPASGYSGQTSPGASTATEPPSRRPLQATLKQGAQRRRPAER
jgi:ATP-dependent RNA helicase DeaD